MTQQTTTKFGKTLFRSLVGAAGMIWVGLLSGCDAGPGGSSSSSAMSTEAKISGNVNDQHGPIVNAKIEVRDKNGNLVTSARLSGDSNHYSLTIPAGTSYPVVLTATPDDTSVRGPVKAVVTSSLADRMDITDVTTIVVDSALALGGLTEQNIAKASGSAIGLRQRQGVSAGAGGSGAGPGQSGGGAGQGGHGGHGGTPSPQHRSPTDGKSDSEGTMAH